MADSAQQKSIIPLPLVHTTLVPEILGFSPQMLLDDIISAAADANLQCIQAMEPFMKRWADTRVAKEDEDWDGVEAVEQGLVAFSTLLESYTDIAFDFFEVWSLRNIFAVPPDLQLVVPHHKGLDLTTKPEEEMELMTEIEELRRKIENQKRLNRMYKKALRLSRIGLSRSKRRLDRLSYFADPSIVETVETLSTQITELFDNATSLPHIDPTITAPVQPPDPSKRLWETGEAGYSNWAVARLIAKSKEHRSSSEGSTAIGDMVEQVGNVGSIQDFKMLVEIGGNEEDANKEDVEMDII